MEYSRCYSQAEVDYLNKWRLLWEQHGFWTRSVIIGIAFDLPDLELREERLLRNPAYMAQALEPFYGRTVAAEYDRLLTEHLVIADRMVKAAKAGNDAAVTAERIKWYIKADEITTLLARINPFWNKAEWLQMFDTHLALVEEEAVTTLTGDYSGSIAVFDAIEIQALEMADEISLGVIKQFPDRFPECCG